MATQEEIMDSEESEEDILDSPPSPPPKRRKSTPKRGRPPGSAKKKALDSNKSPMNYFMKRYTVLQATLNATKSLAMAKSKGRYKSNAKLDNNFDVYTFLTYATKRFIVVLSRIIKESNPDFDLLMWDPDTLGKFKTYHSISRSESTAAVRYLESVFGRLPKDVETKLYNPNMPKPGTCSTGVQTVSSPGTPDKTLVSPGAGIKEIVIKPPAPPRRGGGVKIEKINNLSNSQTNSINENPAPSYVMTADYDDDNDGGADFGADDDNENAPVKELSVKSLLCVFCYKKHFVDIAAFAKHYQQVHCHPDVLEFWINIDLNSAPLTAKQRKAELHQPTRTPFIKCGLCKFKVEDKENTGEYDLIGSYIDHYAASHHPKHCCGYCKKLFFLEPILREHQEHCEAACKFQGRALPAKKADVYYYRKDRCTQHKLDFNDEFLYADHMCVYHIQEVEGGEMAQVLGLSVKQLLAERYSTLGIKYICHMCDSEKGHFDSPTEWLDHVQETHPGRVVCDICCQFVGSLKHHVKNAHGAYGESYFQCFMPDCGYKGACFTNAYQHLRNFHPEADLEIPMEFKRKCVDCDFTVIYRYHKKLMDYSKPSRAMFSHYDKAHDKKFCEKCGNFYARKYYDIHQEKHIAEETGVKKYACSVCDQRFLHKSTLQDHERRHDEKNKTHLCEICCKSFFFRHDLTVHIKVNHTEKSFHCNHCQKSFALQSSLKQHIKKCGQPQNQNQLMQFDCEQQPVLKTERDGGASQYNNMGGPGGPNEEMKIPLTDDMRFVPVTNELTATSHILAQAHSATHAHNESMGEVGGNGGGNSGGVADNMHVGQQHSHQQQTTQTSQHQQQAQHNAVTSHPGMVSLPVHPGLHQGPPSLFTTSAGQSLGGTLDSNSVVAHNMRNTPTDQPQNLTMSSAANVLNTYYNEQQQNELNMAFGDVYRASHSLGMMLPGFNLTGEVTYPTILPQQHQPHQH